MTNFPQNNSPAEFLIFLATLELLGALLGFGINRGGLSCFVFEFPMEDEKFQGFQRSSQKFYILQVTSPKPILLYQRNSQLYLKGAMFILKKGVKNSFPKMWYLRWRWVFYRQFLCTTMYCMSYSRSQRERLVERYLFMCGVLSFGEREDQMSTKIVKCGLSHQ